MLANQSVLAQTALQSVIGGSSILKPGHSQGKSAAGGGLQLTALIDAFSVLVIFLLMSFSSTGEILVLSKDTELPKAALMDQLERFPVIKIEDGQMFVEDTVVTTASLIPELIELRKRHAEIHPGEEYPGIVTVQADRRVKYEVLNQVVLAASAAGFGDIRFAVIAK